MHIPPAKAWNFDVDKYLNPLVPPSRLHLLPLPLSRFLGYRRKATQPLGNLVVAFWSLIGGVAGTCVLAGFFMSPFITERGGPIIVGSFGAAAVLEYGAIESPFSQPRNAILGQFMAAVIGVCITKLFALNADFEHLRWLAGALSVGVASAAMALTKTIHPPAGATALLAAIQPAISGLGWYYLPVVLISSLLTTAVACVINNIQRQFPLYWWTPHDRSKPSRPDEEQAEDKRARPQQARHLNDVETHPDDGELVVRLDGIYLPFNLAISPEEKRVLEILQDRLRSVRESEELSRA